MNGTATSFGRNRVIALIVAGLIIVAPVIWAAWSLLAVSAAEATIESQSALLGQMQQRLTALRAGGSVGLSDAELVYLPGATPAVAGAALQKIVGNAVQAAGGRIVESEVVNAPAEEPDRVDLRVSFDADIVSLQRILFQLETGLPILVMRSLDVQSGGQGEISDTESPPLRVVLLVGGYWETKP